MKRFFVKSPRGSPPPKSSLSSPPNPLPYQHTIGLQPKDIVPPVPHPCPHEHIALLVTKEGLLLRPHLAGPGSHVRIQWGKAVKVEDLPGDGEGEGADWAGSLIIYGIVGVLELFSGMVFPRKLSRIYVK